MRILKRLTPLFLCLLPLSPLFSSPCSLVVTYHTGRNAERLDRVRFRLTNAQREQTFYPESNAFCDDAIAHIRRVVINGLAPGNYTVDFIIPNHDGLFCEVPSRTVTLNSGALLTIDQAIKPRYARLQASARFDTPPAQAPESPSFFLCQVEEKTKIYSKEGKLSANDLLPGEYMLIFEQHSGYETPSPLHLNLTPGMTSGPFNVSYTQTHSKSD